MCAVGEAAGGANGAAHDAAEAAIRCAHIDTDPWLLIYSSTWSAARSSKDTGIAGEAEIKWEIELLFKMLEKHTLDKI